MAGRIVQARVDEETERVLASLRRRTGLSESELVRRALRALNEGLPAAGKRIYGVGRFSSGCPDLGSNKRHLVGFGTS
jgi:hypothetical protein